jgi:hypothetical protein
MRMRYNLTLFVDWKIPTVRQPYGLPDNVWFPGISYTKEKAHKFSLEYDSEIVEHLEALAIRSFTATESNNDPLDYISNKFKKSTVIISSEAGKCRLRHQSYGHTIDLKLGENPTWGPYTPSV